jgi:WS/DGAT/MGAT family acyltransferase
LPQAVGSIVVAQQHLDRLSAVDAAFLHQESPTTHMHIGAVVTLEPPAPDFVALREHVRARLPLVPRYRQKLATPPLALGRQRWIDDPAFNLDYHVRHTALPAPGGAEQLRRLIGRLFAHRLDRTKPLWELWFVEGLEGGRTALVSKTHHALVDGVSGVDLATVLFDLDPEPREIETADAWQPRPEPSPAQLAAEGVRTDLGRIAGLPLRGFGLLGDPERSLADAREALGGVAEVVRAGLDPAPPSPLNVRIGPHRRFEWVSAALDELKEVKGELGGTVNDVVLAVVAGALRRWYHARGLPVSGVTLRACVPVSVRTAGEKGAMGNRLAQMVCPLPLGEGDPLVRYREISAAMAGIKDSRQAIGAEVIASAQEFAPPTILAQASRLNFSSRFYNLLVTNVPGPQIPLYVLGRRIESVFPIPFLAGDRALAVAVMSYDGGMGFGLLGDLDALHDLDAVGRGIREALDELLALTRGEAAPRPKPARARKATPSVTGPAPLHFPTGRGGTGPAASRRAAARKAAAGRSKSRRKPGPDPATGGNGAGPA